MVFIDKRDNRQLNDHRIEIEIEAEAEAEASKL